MTDLELSPELKPLFKRLFGTAPREGELVGRDYLLNPQKRRLDLFAASALLLPAIPMTAVGAALLYLEDPKREPIVRMPRFGGRSVLKLQTMVQGAWDHEGEVANGRTLLELNHAGDPRITKMGKIVRRASLDEMQTVFDVFGRSKSAVGFRMVTDNEYEHFVRPRLTVRDYQVFDQILRGPEIKPGWTGVYVVFGRKGLSWDDRVLLERAYNERATRRTDIHLLLMTPPYGIFHGEGKMKKTRVA